MSVKSGKGKSGSTSAKVFVEENKDMGEMENLGIETVYDVTLQLLSSINVSQSAMENRLHLDDYGGPQCLASNLHVDLKTGLRREQVLAYRQKFGANRFPDSPIDTYWKLLAEALSDTTLVILSIASIVSLVIGIYQDPEIGWVEGAAILIAVFAVSSISAGNDYNKQLQFRDLENASAKDELCSIMRDETMDRYPVEDIVVGDILCLQTGDAVPADCIIIDNSEITTNEASLTGEGEDLKKSTRDDCFLLSSCLVVEGDDCHALVIAVGKHSQWGKIKENLRVTVSNTPLQDKLEEMTKKIGFIGMFFAMLTFIAMVVDIWARRNGENIAGGFIKAFIMAVTIIVVAIPEGLPLAVTIALAFSTKKMYNDQCFIRILAACETMGNATNICSDKTGTLTENSMTVVEGWFADQILVNQEDIAGVTSKIPTNIQRLLSECICVNRTAYLSHYAKDGERLPHPQVIGSKTEGALLMICESWKTNYEDVKSLIFDETNDLLLGFNSTKKRSTCVIHRVDKSVRIFVKGASEQLLLDCYMYTDRTGRVLPMSEKKYEELDAVIEDMANRALRTLLIAHRDFSSAAEMEAAYPDWRSSPPDSDFLCVDAVVGIMDPLRGDVAEAVKTAQEAGVVVRMVTGDNISTAIAIAKQCGILIPGGLAIEGPVFRSMRPADLDAILPRLQVMARSSPEDKMTLVTRLNGHAVPKNRAEWESKMHSSGRYELTWDKDRDDILPGYYEEWAATRPDGGHVVSVTGDGTNDAPALKAADVGLAMGITGTKVAQSAADIVILDDRFSSIVRAITWGRCVYDNIRKFLQFQLTVNIVALTLVFFSALSGAQEPITAVQMLWVNLVMDSLGALALGTEEPTPSLLKRRPYKRNANLVSNPMLRNILCQAALQLALCFYLMFAGPELFGIRGGEFCHTYSQLSDATYWNVQSMSVSNSTDISMGNYDVTCGTYKVYCPKMDLACLEQKHVPLAGTGLRTSTVTQGTAFSFHDLPHFTSRCLKCIKEDHTHGTIIFNTFIWCQIFNEYASRMLFDEVNMFEGLWRNRMFIYVSIVTMFMQVFIVEVCGSFMKTSSLTTNQWLSTIGLGFFTIPVGVLMRFIPVKEQESDYFDLSTAGDDKSPSSEQMRGAMNLLLKHSLNGPSSTKHTVLLPANPKYSITSSSVVTLTSATNTASTLTAASSTTNTRETLFERL